LSDARASQTDGPLLGGLDIGGTKIGMSVGLADGRVLASDRLDLDPARDPGEVLGECRERLLTLAARASRPLAAVGCACPGPLDYKAGRFINPPNNPRWHGFGLRDWLASQFPCPSAMMNDANAAALAEFLWGAARGTRTSVFLTMSTGMAGEIGRIRLRDSDDGPVGFGRRGSVEGYTSGPGMSQLARSEAIACIHRNEATSLRTGLESGRDIPPRDLCEAARAGDAAARRVTDRIALELGRIMAIMTDILNPDLFVLGTIGSAYPDLFIPGATAALQREAIPEAAANVRVVGSGLTDRGHQQALAVAARLIAAPSPGPTA
jgi:glucokinase